MSIFYLLVSVVCNGFQAYLVYQYYHMLFQTVRTGKRITVTACFLFCCCLTLLPSAQLGYFMSWLLQLLLYFVMSFLFKTDVVKKLLAILLLTAVLLAIDSAMIHMSGRIGLGLFNPPLFSAVISRILYTTILWLLYLLAAFMIEWRRNKQVLLLKWLTALLPPFSVLYLLVYSLLVDINILSRNSDLHLFHLFILERNEYPQLYFCL